MWIFAALLVATLLLVVPYVLSLRNKRGEAEWMPPGEEDRPSPPPPAG